MILRIGRESGLMFQNVLESHRVLAPDGSACFILEFREIALNRIGNIDLAFADQHLQRIVGRVHFGVGR